MVTYLPRSAWGARASKGSTSLAASQVLGTALHWPGMAKPIDATGEIGKRRIASALRGWQAFHMDVRGWSDIAYCVAVDQAGRAWTLRGLNIRSGANGDATVNRQYGAILLILAPGEKPSVAMKATVRGVVADFRRWFPKGTLIRPHSAVRPAGTDCPGPAARAAIANGDFSPLAATPPTEDDMPYTEAQLRAMMQAENEEYAIRFWVSPGGTGTALIRRVDALGAAVAALGQQMTAEDSADDAALKTAVAELKTEIGKAIPQPPKA